MSVDVPRVIVITGIQAAGKSTVAQAVAERLDRSVHVRGDVYRRMIVNGRARIVPGGGAAMDDELRLRYRLSAMVANTYAAAGYTAVVQDILLGDHLAEYVQQVTARPLGIVVLAPRPDVVAAREESRSKTAYVDGWTPEGLHDDLCRSPRVGLWLDIRPDTRTDRGRDLRSARRNASRLNIDRRLRSVRLALAMCPVPSDGLTVVCHLMVDAGPVRPSLFAVCPWVRRVEVMNRRRSGGGSDATGEWFSASVEEVSERVA